jgi:cysteinyl-tRNA synthetase
MIGPVRMHDGPMTNAPHDVVRSADLSLSGRRLPMVGSARVYVCGITPYDVTHLGHAATFVWADVAAAVLRMAGVHVITCRNITDVDDVLTEAAGSRGRPYDEFALYQQYLFDKDMAALGVREPVHQPQARHHVVQVQHLAAALLTTERAYERNGFVHFRGAGVVERAGLSAEQAFARSAEYGDQPGDPDRDDPFDVPVWRPSTGAEPAWPSPWGPGRPGWHAECAAMAMSVLGSGVDILAGGADLAFPHHAYQAAMVEAASAVTPFARSHLHVGAVHQDGTKMSKSTGNLTLVAHLLRDHSAAAVRLLLLDRRWSEPWEYRPDDLERAGTRLHDLYAAAGRPGTTTSATAAVTEALVNDLDVPGAVAVAVESGGEAARLVLRVLSLA